MDSHQQAGLGIYRGIAIRIDGLDDLLSELKAQGRNLNQLTTLANMGRISVLRGDDLIREYTRLCDTLGALVWKAR